MELAMNNEIGLLWLSTPSIVCRDVKKKSADTRKRNSATSRLSAGLTPTSTASILLKLPDGGFRTPQPRPNECEGGPLIYKAATANDPLHAKCNAGKRRERTL